MTVRIETLPDGRKHYISDGHLVLTGPIKGTVATADGTVYDVNEYAVEVPDHHAMEVAEEVGRRYMLEGHPEHLFSDVPFVHVPQSDMSNIEGPTAGISTTSANQSLDALGGSLPGSPLNVLAYVNLNTGATGSTGANEMSGSTRQACTWNNAASGSKTNSSSLSFTTPGTTAASNFSTWSASTAGTFGIGGALSSNVTATSITAAAGALTLGSSSTS